jgi:hypothetical protein
METLGIETECNVVEYIEIYVYSYVYVGLYFGLCCYEVYLANVGCGRPTYSSISWYTATLLRFTLITYIMTSYLITRYERKGARC